MKTVELRIDRNGCICQEDGCGESVPKNEEGLYNVSDHLRKKHGFTGEITFEKASEVICPPMQFVRATCR